MLEILMKNKFLIFLKVLKIVVSVVLGTIGGYFLTIIDITTVIFTIKTFALIFLIIIGVFILATIWVLLDLLFDNKFKTMKTEIKKLKEELLEI